MKILTGLALVAATALGVGTLRFWTLDAAPPMAPATAAPVDAPTSSAQTQGSILRSGTFVAAEHPTTGMVRIVMAGKQRFVKLDNTFRTPNSGRGLREFGSAPKNDRNPALCRSHQRAPRPVSVGGCVVPPV